MVELQAYADETWTAFRAHFQFSEERQVVGKKINKNGGTRPRTVPPYEPKQTPKAIKAMKKQIDKNGGEYINKDSLPQVRNVCTSINWFSEARFSA